MGAMNGHTIQTCLGIAQPSLETPSTILAPSQIECEIQQNTNRLTRSKYANDDIGSAKVCGLLPLRVCNQKREKIDKVCCFLCRTSGTLQHRDATEVTKLDKLRQNTMYYKGFG